MHRSRLVQRHYQPADRCLPNSAQGENASVRRFVAWLVYGKATFHSAISLDQQRPSAVVGSAGRRFYRGKGPAVSFELYK